MSEGRCAKVPDTLTIASLFDDPPIVVERPLTPEERFVKFHNENRHVYVALRQVALDLVDRGLERFSINMCFEVVRWQQFIRTHDNTAYAMNNTYRSRYSRMLMENEPRLANVFETRTLHG
jgi:hypothetical protein